MSKGLTVAVVGGGYAGVTAANRLRASLTPDEASRVRVVVYSAELRFVERIRLHELVAGSREGVDVPFGEILRSDIDVVVGFVEHIDAAERTLRVRVGDVTRQDRFDYLIYTVGSEAVRPEGAFAVASAADARVARVRIADSGPGLPVVVVGGGATGVETASEIAAAHPAARVALVSSSEVLAALPAGSRRAVFRSLDRLGVTVVENESVVGVGRDFVELGSGRRLLSAVTLWAVGFTVSKLAQYSGLAVDEVGRLDVDETLRSVSSPVVFGAGDAVHVPDQVGAHLRMSCAAAVPMGGHAANSVLAELRGQPRPTLSIGFLIQCYSLGRNDGLIQLVSAADVPRPLRLTGGLAATVKESICKLVVTGPTKEGSKPNTYWTPKGPSPHRIAAR